MGADVQAESSDVDVEEDSIVAHVEEITDDDEMADEADRAPEAHADASSGLGSEDEDEADRALSMLEERPAPARDSSPPTASPPASVGAAPPSQPSYPTSETVETALPSTASARSSEPLTYPRARVEPGRATELLDGATPPYVEAVSSAKPSSEDVERKPNRPRDVWFRSNPDEVTMSAFSMQGVLGHTPATGSGPQTVREDALDPLSSLSGIAVPHGNVEDGVTSTAIPSEALTSRGEDVSAIAASVAAQLDEDDDMAETGELPSSDSTSVTGLDYLDATLARPKKQEEMLRRRYQQEARQGRHDEDAVTSHGEEEPTGESGTVGGDEPTSHGEDNTSVRGAELAPNGDENTSHGDDIEGIEDEVLNADELPVDIVEEEEDPKTEVTEAELVTKTS
jgi:hypothetical protein